MGGESITFTPGDGGGAHTFNAPVFREEPDLQPGSISRHRTAIVWVPYSADGTVGRAAVTETKDKVNLVMERGKAAVDAVVSRVLQNTTGFIVIEVRS